MTRNYATTLANKTIMGPIAGFFALLMLGFVLFAWSGYDFQYILDITRSTNPLVFVILLTILPLLGFPIAVFYLYAGTAFAWPAAWLLCTIGLALNMSVAYTMGAHLLRKPLIQILAHRGYSLPVLNETTHFKFIFLIRAVPGVPFPIQNYLLSVTAPPFILYLSISLAVQSVFAAGVSALPSMLIDPGNLKLLLAAAILVLLLIAKVILRFRDPSTPHNKIND